MIVREATPSDVEDIAKLHAESWRSAYRGILSDAYLKDEVYAERRRLWEERFFAADGKPTLVLVAEETDGIAGFLCMFPEEHPLYGSLLDNLHVAPNATGKGIGGRLLSEAAQRLVKTKALGGLYLWVLARNERARRFYAKAGAVEVESLEMPVPDGQRLLEVRCHWPDVRTLLDKSS